MQYMMKERFFSLTDVFDITDASGNPVYTVRGKFFSFGDKLVMSDTRGSEVARIHQKLLSFRKTYEIVRDGRTVATVQKKLFTLLRHRFTVDVPGPDDLEAVGNFLEHEFTFERAGREVARVSKRFFSFRDTYGIDVAPDQDPVIILCSAIVIDMVLHEGKDD